MHTYGAKGDLGRISLHIAKIASVEKLRKMGSCRGEGGTPVAKLMVFAGLYFNYLLTCASCIMDI